MKKNIVPSPLPVHLKCLFALLFFCLSASTGLQAQTVYKLNGSKDNVVKVLGKSNIHDWVMTAQNPFCESTFGAISTDTGVPKNLASLTFSVKAKSLKSQSESMNNRTYKTIKADAFPDIIFKLGEATVTPLSKNKFSVNAKGTLTIAGVSKLINLQVTGAVNADDTILCSGQQKIKLTDFGIQPPSFMLGAMKVADELTISFVLNFKK